MCGIAAVFGVRPYSAEPFLRSMLGRIRHRGFSHNEIWSSPTVALGANRLEIVDPKGGRQPVSNEASSIVAVLNGEIYNHNELREQLRSRGHFIQSECDAEILVHAFEEWGIDFCTHLRGMFALILYDKQTKRILFARDPVGIKPLYIGHGNNGALFAASEAKSLVGLAKNANLLPPGGIFDGTAIAFYPQLEEAWTNPRLDDAAEQLRKLLADSVALHLPPDLPFAVFLSGGIDSSLILALAARMRPDVIAITFGLPGSTEVRFAAQLCQALRIQHDIVEVSFETLMSRFEKVVWHLESFEPNLVRASLITDALCRRAHQLGLRVALVGEGADEYFGGYDDFFHLSEDCLESTLRKFSNDLHRTQLLRWDKLGMAHTLEVRTPFIDRRVLAFARSLPPILKVGKLPDHPAIFSKAVLREAARGLVPDANRLRQKVPMDDGVVSGGAAEWNNLISSFYSSRPLPSLPKSLSEKFAVTEKEELVNITTLLQFLPLEFISTSRITVRRKPA